MFEDVDLPFIPLVNNVDPGVLPFGQLLIRINQTHRSGLETGPEFTL